MLAAERARLARQYLRHANQRGHHCGKSIELTLVNEPTQRLIAGYSVLDTVYRIRRDFSAVKSLQLPMSWRRMQRIQVSDDCRHYPTMALPQPSVASSRSARDLVATE